MPRSPGRLLQWLHTAERATLAPSGPQGTIYRRSERPPRQAKAQGRPNGMTDRVALITGVTGQDGACLAELLLDCGYVVHGVKRRSSSFNTGRIDHLYLDPHEGDTRFFLHYGDLTDATNLVRLVQETRPDEIYNLAAQSHVQVSFETPEYTANSDALGTLRLLEALRILNRTEEVRFYQGSTSELYGNAPEVPQNEATPFSPPKPLRGRQAVRLLDHGQLSRGIRHPRFERHRVQPRRADARRNLRDPQDHPGGRLHRPRIAGPAPSGEPGGEARLGDARDYVDGMWRIVNHERPGDFVLATGKAHSVREFVELAFREVDVDIAWEGAGMHEKGRDARTGAVRVEIDPRYFRPTEVDLLVGDATKAREVLGWAPRTTFEELVSGMVRADLKAMSGERAGNGNRRDG